MIFSYNYLEAKTEKELQRKLVELQVQGGYTVRIINIYPSGSKVVAWYYANPKDALHAN
jgi:hypothetical protein